MYNEREKMKRLIAILLIFVVSLLLYGNVFAEVSADPEVDTPEDVRTFEFGRLTCIIFPDGSGECYDLSENGGKLCGCSCIPLPLPTDVPTGQPSSTPGSTPDPTNTPGPTNTPELPTSTPTDTPKEPKASCNRGIGNFSEDCDPGNSYGQGGGKGRPAGEDRFEEDGAPPNKDKK